uniref:Uncharacterized protein n=1 Tax=Cucumis sativus TaxID=3659 RepID=A0A0A0KZC7_CUCSA
MMKSLKGKESHPLDKMMEMRCNSIVSTTKEVKKSLSLRKKKEAQKVSEPINNPAGKCSSSSSSSHSTSSSTISYSIRARSKSGVKQRSKAHIASLPFEPFPKHLV